MYDRKSLGKRERQNNSLLFSESFWSVNSSCRKGERDGGANAVSSLPRCLGRQRSASIKVRENNEAKKAAANFARVTLAKLPSLTQQNPFVGPCIAPPPPKNVIVPSIVPKNGLLHSLADVVVHDKRRAHKESVIQMSAREENARVFPDGRGGLVLLVFLPIPRRRDASPPSSSHPDFMALRVDGVVKTWRCSLSKTGGG